MKLYDEKNKVDFSQAKMFDLENGTRNLQRYDKFKYQFFYKQGEKMDQNFWKPSEVSLTKDVQDFKLLEPHEQRILTLNIKRQEILDSLQGRAVIHTFGRVCTLPELEYWITRLTYQETNHSDTYAHILKNVFDDATKVFDEILDDVIITEHSRKIAQYYEKFYELINKWESYPNYRNENTLKNLKKSLVLALVSWNILEGVRFYVSFACTFAFGENKKMEGNAKELKLIARDENCLHPDTEVLTSNGWKKIELVSEDDLVAQYDMSNENISFANPIAKIWKDYDGLMYKLVDNRGKVLQHITNEHDVVVKMTKTNTIKKEIIENSKFNSSKNIPVSGYGIGEKTTLTSYERLLIAISADGWIDKIRTGKNSGNQIVHLSVKKERKKERILKLLEESNVEYSIHKDIKRNDYLILYIKIPHALKVDKFFEWIELDKISSNWCKEFMAELVLWDGHITKDRDSLYYSSTRKEEFDKVLAV